MDFSNVQSEIQILKGLQFVFITTKTLSKNMAERKLSPESPALEDTPVNRLIEFISYSIAEFNIKASKQLLMSKVSKETEFYSLKGLIKMNFWS